MKKKKKSKYCRAKIIKFRLLFRVVIPREKDRERNERFRVINILSSSSTTRLTRSRRVLTWICFWAGSNVIPINNFGN